MTRSNRFIDTSTAGAAPARVGPYRLVRELGRGGMGAVYLAERDDDEYRAKVAIKLVRPGMDTEFILARFRRERQTLARLHHPNIADCSTAAPPNRACPTSSWSTSTGRASRVSPTQRKLAIEARLRLFLAVCAAVDYAHRNFIVHRDLKPGNILVDAEACPSCSTSASASCSSQSASAGHRHAMLRR